MLTGRIESGRIAVGDTVKALSRDGKRLAERSGSLSLWPIAELKRVPVDRAEAGRYCRQIAGLVDATVADTIGALRHLTQAMPSQPIDPPTLSITVSINDSRLRARRR